MGKRLCRLAGVVGCAVLGLAQTLNAVSTDAPPEVVLVSDRPAPVRVPIVAQPTQWMGRKLEPPLVRPAVKQYNIKNYATDDTLALPLDSLVSFLTDKLGRVWIGSYGGSLYLYDGRRFTNFTLQEGMNSPSTYAIASQKEGSIWLGTWGGGLNIFDGSRFIVRSTKEGLVNDYVHALLIDSKGRTWVGTQNGVSLYEGLSVRNFTTDPGLPKATITTFLEDNEGNIWLGSDGGGVSKYDGHGFINYTTEDGLLDNKVLSSLKDSKGNLWFGTQSGVCLYNKGRFVTFAQAALLPGTVITALFEDTQGKIWFGTDKGVAVWEQGAITIMSKQNGLAANDVRAIGQDNSGGIWILTYQGGPSRYDGGLLSWFNPSSGLSDGFVVSIVEGAADGIWISHSGGGGLEYYNGATFTKYTTAQGLPSNTLHQALRDKDNILWISSTRGLTKFDGKAFTTYTTQQGLAGDNAYAVLQDLDGSLWITTANGVSRFDGKKFTNYRKPQGLADNVVNSLFQDSQHRLWFFHWYSGKVSRFNGKAFQEIDGAQNASVGWEDEHGVVWLGALDGLIRYDGTSYLRFTTSDGLVDNFVLTLTAIKADGQKTSLLIGTNNGLSLLTGFRNLATHDVVGVTDQLSNRELRDHYRPLFDTFGVSNGYLIKNVSASGTGLLQDSKGKIWFGTSYLKTSLVEMDFSALHIKKEKPVVQIESVKIDNESILWSLLAHKGDPNYPQLESSQLSIEEKQTFGRKLRAGERTEMARKFRDIQFTGLDQFFPVPRGLQLPYSKNNIAFSFYAVDMAQKNNTYYQYKLEGYDKDWGQPTKNSFATFGNIAEGRYQFMVRAQNAEGIWGDPAVFNFEVFPPWYRTWWAYVLYSTSTLAFLFAIYRWRTATLRRRQRMLEVLYQAAERFVPKAFLSLLGKHNIQDVNLGDSIETTVTVLFTDIRGYTTLAERLSPSESYAHINNYWKNTAPIIERHHGFIGKYLGDGAMALFPRSPDDAVEAVLDMMEALIEFNRDQKIRDGDPIKVGYGLNTGMAMLGTIGVEMRMDADVISNTSNLASRVESLNKFYGTRFLVSSLTLNGLTDKSKYTVRFIDKIKAKGMTKTVRVFEIYPRGPISEEERAFIETYENAFELYEKGAFKEALVLFEACHLQKPDDVASVVLMERCGMLIKTGAPKDWDGTIEMTHK